MTGLRLVRVAHTCSLRDAVNHESKRPNSRYTFARGALIPCCLALLLGCSSGGRPAGDLPELHPARGEVTRSGASVAGGFLQFRLESGDAGLQDLIVTSAIEADGSFELFTTHALSQDKASGAPAGVFSVTYLPPGESQDVMPVTLSKTVMIAEGPNELAIELGAE